MAKHLACIVVLSALVIAVSNALDWCSITCPDYYHENSVFQHTMCTFKVAKPAQKCNRVVKRRLNESQIELVVDYHNRLRSSVGDLPPLKWDKKLATVAQRWANQCDYNHHDKCRNLKTESVGQNMAYYWLTDRDPTLEELMAGWVDEGKHVDGNMIACFPERTNNVITHYTQMVWRKTTKIGCGFIKFLESKTFDGVKWDGYTSFLVCNYGEAGNWVGERVY